MSSITTSKLGAVLTFLSRGRVVLAVWVLLAVIATSKQILKGNYNNYLIFKNSFWHAWEQKNLYAAYPAEYFDLFYYGPIFPVLMAPFAVLPDFLGGLLWQLANNLFLFYAISRLPLKHSRTIAVLWLVAHEALTAMFNFQINAGIAALVIMSLCLIREKKDFWAACLIMLGTFIKLYGIVGVAFFFFSRQKPTLVLSCIFWAMVFFGLPMLLFTPDFVLQSYQDWYTALAAKNQLNSTSIMQDISVMGMARRILQDPTLPNLPFLAAGLVLFFLPYLRISQYRHAAFQMMLLASVLLFVVLFSSGSESPTYVIAFTGVALWFMLQGRPIKPLYVGLMVFAFLLTSLSPSDLFPKVVREEFIKPFSLKALPCLLVWLAVTYDLLKTNFAQASAVAPDQEPATALPE
ncbi:glycosyltransferase family 87 protein [Rufibacter sp. LB8]|uniref:glycosyltransferase family 87 protein n=1 Tax=Rufibacter sp. LB8 TaxID=2777781 RepID=UPI001CEFA6ED|nr:glycosyltransferase family 87 protein [Rufibacter sp. LB8]